MAISNCLFSPTSENPRGFSVWCVLTKLPAKPQLLIAETVVRKLKMTTDRHIKLGRTTALISFLAGTILFGQLIKPELYKFLKV